MSNDVKWQKHLDLIDLGGWNTYLGFENEIRDGYDPDNYLEKLLDKMQSNMHNDLRAMFLFEFWENEDSPMTTINKDEKLLKYFIKTYNKYAEERNNIVLFRGTANLNRLDLTKGDIIDYSTRYTSWSADRSATERYYDYGNGVIFKIVCSSIKTIYLNTFEKEHILSPMKLEVVDIYKEIIRHEEYDEIVNIYECLIIE